LIVVNIILLTASNLLLLYKPKNLKKKILIRIGSLRHGGAEKVLITLLNQFSPEKYDIDLLINLKSGKYLAQVPTWVNLYYLNKGEMIETNRLHEIPIKAFRVLYQGFYERFPKVLYQNKLRNKKYDIEIAAIQGAADWILNSPIKSSRKILWIHNDLSNFPEYTKDKIQRFFQFDKIMVISDKIQKWFEDQAINDTQKQKLVRIYNPIDTKEIIDLSEKPIQNPFQNNYPIFLGVGTVFNQKGFDRLLTTHEKLIKENHLHNVMIVGNGPDLEKLQDLVNQKKLQNTFKFLGFQTNPYPFFKLADYFILSSRYEGYPTVLYEAFILQKPIVATDVSGVKEILKNGDLGLIVDNSENGIYLGIKKILSDKSLSLKYLNELKSTELPFTLEKSVQLIEQIINEK